MIKVMGQINLIPLFGTSFPSFFPLILVILCLTNLCEIYGKIMSYFGLQ